MKRVIGIIVLAMMVILPISVNAASSNYEMVCSTEKLEKREIKTCNIIADLSGKSLNRFSINFTFGPVVKIQSVTPNGDWKLESNTATDAGATLIFTSAESLTNKFTIATVVFDIDRSDANADCTIQYMPCPTEDGFYGCGNDVVITEDNTCKVVGGKYYGKNGNEVTQAVYEAECMNNPQTGSFVPYVVIIAGVALAVGVFTISRKNTKLYKI